MYIPKHFEITDTEEILAFLKANAFGQITSMVEGKLFASHIPFLASEDGSVLMGHLAKANPQWNSIQNQEVLVTFQGPHDYISPSWYSSPGVPTWNYQTVHVYGLCKIIRDSDRLKEIVDALTKFYESQFSAQWTIEYSSSMLQGIVGIEIQVTDIQCKYKLNQNRSDKDRLEVIKQLESKGSSELALAMSEIEL